MALSGLPPWLDVHPSDFVRAASEGAQAGLAVARLNQAADEAAQRAAEHGKEFEEAQALRKWEQQQQMQMHAEQMRAAFQKSKDDLEARTMYQRSMIDARKQAEKDRMDTANQNLDFRRQTQGWHQSRFDLEKQKFDAQISREGKKLSGEDSANVKVLEGQVRQLNAAALNPNMNDPDGTKKTELQNRAESLRMQILGIYRAASTGPGSAGGTTPQPIPEPMAPGSSGKLGGPGGYLSAPTDTGSAPIPDIQPGWQNIPGINPTTGGTAPPVAPAAIPPSPSMPASGRIRVKSPNGKIGHIPPDQLNAALAAGYKQMDVAPAPTEAIPPIDAPTDGASPDDTEGDPSASD